MTLGEYALKFYYEGYNCSLCILKSGEKKYGICINDDIKRGVLGIGGGFGFGGMCGVLISAVMLLSMICDEHKFKICRLKLFDSFNIKYGSFDCANISKNDCEDVIKYVCDVVENIIE